MYKGQRPYHFVTAFKRSFVLVLFKKGFLQRAFFCFAILTLKGGVKMQSQSHSVAPIPIINIFELVRDIPMEDILKRYSPTEAKHRGGKLWYNCPFHQDKHPSLKAKGQRWRCFGCGVWGDGVDYVSKLYDLAPLVAAKQIASDFGIVVNHVLTEKQRKSLTAAKEARQAKRVFDQAVDHAYQQLCDVRIECCRIIDAAGEYGLRFSHVPDMIDTYLDVLQFGTDTEKRDFLSQRTARNWSQTLERTKGPINSSL